MTHNEAMSTLQTTSSLNPYRLRCDFPILSQLVHDNKPLIYLDNAASTQRPNAVIQTLVEMYEKHYANVHRGIHWLSDQATDRYEEAREKIRQFVGAERAQEIIFTTGTTAAINLVARSWGDERVGAGDEILVTEMEHHSNLVPWQQLADRTGCRIRAIPITDDGELDLGRLEELITETTRLVAVTAVSNVLGTINPIVELASWAHRHGALVLVDAAQAAPHAPIDVQAWDADFVAFSGHKMLGPSGVGVLYGREALLDSMPPFLGGGSMIRRVRIDGFEPADLPAKFEAGTPPIVSAIGLGAAIDYLQRIGQENVLRYEQTLTARIHEVFSQIDAVRVLGPPPERKAGIVTFVMDGIHAHDVAQVLDRQGIAVRAGHHCTMPLHKRLGVTATTRASVYFYNTPEEVDQLGQGLEETLRVFRRH
jgi:cysteine desulfurase/selenocysteine lyase